MRNLFSFDRLRVISLFWHFWQSNIFQIAVYHISLASEEQLSLFNLLTDKPVLGDDVGSVFFLIELDRKAELVRLSPNELRETAPILEFIFIGLFLCVY